MNSRFDKFVQHCCCCVPEFIQIFFASLLKKGLPQSSWFEDMSKLPKALQYFISISFNAGFLCLFTGLFFNSYYEGRSSSFISLEISAGDCGEVGRPTTGSFLLSSGIESDTTDYAWSTTTEFMYNSSAYMLTMVAYTATIEEYNQQIADAGSSLQSMGIRGKDRDLAWNLLVWSTFVFRSETDSAGVFQLSTLGTPATIFQTETLLAGISGSAGYCDTPTSTFFGDGRYIITLSLYFEDQTCRSQINTEYLVSLGPLGETRTVGNCHD